MSIVRRLLLWLTVLTLYHFCIYLFFFKLFTVFFIKISVGYILLFSAHLFFMILLFIATKNEDRN